MARKLLDIVKEKSNMMEKKESKCIVTAAYGDLFVSPEDAVALLEIYSRAERYERYNEYNKKIESHHIWDGVAGIQITSMSMSLYQCAKLAGKREEK